METTHLGKSSALPASPDEAVLDYVPNPRPGALYLVRFAAPEFTSLCPVTGQPDFAHLVIDYAPSETIVESKSLKLFLGSYRNHVLAAQGVAPFALERLDLLAIVSGHAFPLGCLFTAEPEESESRLRNAPATDRSRRLQEVPA